MAAMKSLSALLDGINILERTGEGDPAVTGITYDSRRVKPGFLFTALDGVHTDGHAFIAPAVALGARAVVHSRPLENYSPGVVYLRVDDCRVALSALSSAFFDHPSRNLIVIGVTGTDGKSSTVSFIHQLLEAQGLPAGFLSTVEFKPGGTVAKNPYRQSTPEAPEVHGLLSEMRENGKVFAVVESTSHGLSGKTSRLRDVVFDVAVCTNITHEHLEFHGSLENYRHDKANLFRALETAAALPEKAVRGAHGNGMPFGVVNADDPNCEYLLSATGRPVYRYSLKDPSADLSARILGTDLSGTRFLLSSGGREIETRIGFPGTYNVENILAALLAVMGATGKDLASFVPLLPRLRPVKGRMHPVAEGQPFTVIVDYAHTPGAFERVLPFARSCTQGRLTVVFGSGGERDLEKRPAQGKLASQYCDRIILTDEDPRLEDRMKILEEIASGCAGSQRNVELHKIPDRRTAIRKAFETAGPGDTVLLLGKGHEASIIQSDGPHPWDEAAVAEELLHQLGYRKG